MEWLPARFLFRLTYPCHYVKGIPNEEGESLLDLPLKCRVDHLPELDEVARFADVRIAWNELGLGLQLRVKGKEKPLVGDAARPRSSDGIMFWIDTRDTRNIHRASRYCHQFYFLAAGEGEDRSDPTAGQLKINRALQDAPLCSADQLAFQVQRVPGGYQLEAFLPAAVLSGFDPETNPRLGFYYAVRDEELGEQTLGLGNDFPYWEDPSLWQALELTR